MGRKSNEKLNRIRPNGEWLWVIYKNPKDFPNKFVARAFRTKDATPTTMGMVCDTIGELQEELHERGFVLLGRHRDDDPCIVETWV